MALLNSPRTIWRSSPAGYGLAKIQSLLWLRAVRIFQFRRTPARAGSSVLCTDEGAGASARLVDKSKSAIDGEDMYVAITTFRKSFPAGVLTSA